MNPSQYYQQRLSSFELSKLNHRTTERWMRCEAGRGHRYRNEATIWRDGLVMHVCLRCKVPAIVELSTNELARKNLRRRVAKQWNGPITPAAKPSRAA